MLQSAGAKVIVTARAADLAAADKIVLPGIGHFGQAVENLSRGGLLETLTDQVVGKGKPVLGICLGMQLMMAMSEEAPGYYGLAWLGGEVVRLHATDTRHFKVPHIGWNSILLRKESRLLRGIADGTSFYFTHSYNCLVGDSSSVAALTHYDSPFVSVIEQGSIFAVQFHPEKSHAAGATLLQNFVTI
jgi:glutamine amidotransferase